MMNGITFYNCCFNRTYLFIKFLNSNEKFNDELCIQRLMKSYL